MMNKIKNLKIFKNWITTLLGVLVILATTARLSSLDVDTISLGYSVGVILIWAKDNKAINLIKALINKKDDSTGSL